MLRLNLLCCILIWLSCGVGGKVRPLLQGGKCSLPVIQREDGEPQKRNFYVFLGISLFIEYLKIELHIEGISLKTEEVIFWLRTRREVDRVPQTEFLPFDSIYKGSRQVKINTCSDSGQRSIYLRVSIAWEGAQEPSKRVMFYILIFLKVLQVWMYMNTDKALNIKICGLTKCYILIQIKKMLKLMPVKKKIPWDKWQWKHSHTKSMGCSKAALGGKFIAIQIFLKNEKSLK